MNRNDLLKELFLLTKDGHEYMSFLNQDQPPVLLNEEEQCKVPILTEGELLREKAFVDHHQYR
jgi:hypothetical protein